ncbi:MAG: hypothetical protein K5745_04700 [Saccharofermentans sp.]|nr:hypothetical protein [Saccharofermentans sp.]
MNFKKVMAVALGASMVMSMAACSNTNETLSSDVNVISTQDQEGQINEAPLVTIDEDAAEQNYVFTYEGVNIVVSTSMNDILSSLNSVAGEPQYFESASCAGQGMSKTYTYNGGSFTISTNPVGSDDVIASISLFDDSVTTAEGIYIGSTVDDVTAAYGDATSSTDTTFTYEKGSSVLVFIADANGVITNIIYNAKV